MSNVISFPAPKKRQPVCSRNELVQRARIIFLATGTGGDVPQLLANMDSLDIVKWSDCITEGDFQINEYMSRFSWKSYKAARQVAVAAELYLPESVLFNLVKQTDERWGLRLIKETELEKSMFPCPFLILGRWCHQV